MTNTTFKKGDCVNGKTWSGRSFLGLYEGTYNDGSHSVIDVTTGKRFNVHKGDVTTASDSEAEEIKRISKQNGIKLREDFSANYVSGKRNSTTPKPTKVSADEELEAAMEATE